MRLHLLWVPRAVHQFVTLFQSGKYFFIFWALGCCTTLNMNAQCPITVDAGPDQYVCNPPAAVTLDGNISGDYLSFLWTPTTGMSGANTLTPTVNVNQTLNYVLSATAVDPGLNVVDNGDFEQGNSGFSTDYVYNPGFTMFPFGSYEVASVPAAFPACPDHTEKEVLFELLDASRNTGISLTESFAMYPTAAVSGWYFAHPESKYFGLGKIEKDQVVDYAARKGMSQEETERWLSPVLAYDPI